MRQERLSQRYGASKGVGEIARNRNKWPKIFAKPFAETMSWHYRRIASPKSMSLMHAMARALSFPLVYWVLPEDYCKKDPCNFKTEMFVSKVGNPCPTLGQLLASRILYALLIGENQHKIARAIFCTQSCLKVGQLLVNSSPTPHPMGSCKGLPCNSPLATPEKSSCNS